MGKEALAALFLLILLFPVAGQEKAVKRARHYGISIGLLPTGKTNSIVDVEGVSVGQLSFIEGSAIRTGVTAILAHGGNLFQEKVPAAIFVGNGFGKLAGSTQVRELGNLESPIVLTNTLNVAQGIDGVIDYILRQQGNEQVKSVNALVGETNDGYLNDIRARRVTSADVQRAIELARPAPPEEGNVGAGTGTVCFGFKGGIGTASRVLPSSLGGYRVGVLVQSNFGGALQIDGVPVGEMLKQFDFSDKLLSADGSCMIVVATDAPILSRNLERLAKRAFMGLAKTGGIASNGSGDYVIAFSTAESVRVKADAEAYCVQELTNDAISPLFMAAIEATEEAIINSLFAARTMDGQAGRRVSELPTEKVIGILKDHQRLKP